MKDTAAGEEMKRLEQRRETTGVQSEGGEGKIDAHVRMKKPGVKV